MALLGRRGHPSHRRAVLLYLVAIVGPTLVLFYLGLQSVQRQRQAVNALTVSNLRLSGERLAVELERRVTQRAEACLRDAASDELRATLGGEGEGAVGEARHIRSILSSVEGRHAVAQHLFVLDANTVRFPLLRAPPRRPLESYLAQEDPQVGQRFASLFAEAEDQELRQSRAAVAADTYRQSSQLPVSDALTALALARVARSLQAGTRREEAEAVYRSLMDQYADLYDPFHRPYGLVAGLELDESARTHGRSSTEHLVSLYHDFTQGRWELSAEQFDYFKTILERRLGGEAWPESVTAFQRHLDLARALEEGFRHTGPVVEEELYADTLARGQTSYQVYYRALPGTNGRAPLIGLAVDLDWVREALLPDVLTELGLADEVAVDMVRRSVAVSGSTVATDVALTSLVPFWSAWQLAVAPASIDTLDASGRRDLVVFAGSTLFVLGVLVLGIVVLMHHVSRELEINQFRADFVSSVSHELKTPLTLIRLYGETLMDGEDCPEEERQRYYGIITRESERLTHLIEKVLDFSRVERGEKQYHLVSGAITPVVARTVEAYGQYLKRRGFLVETDLATELPPVRFDADAVAAAVVNLVDNAAKYSGTPKFVAVRLRPEGDEVILEVEDHGPGIPASEQEKVFERFYRGRGERAKGGYGLGLFLVQHIMEAHGGRVELDSGSERGSRFRLVFPALMLPSESRSVEGSRKPAEAL